MNGKVIKGIAIGIGTLIVSGGTAIAKYIKDIETKKKEEQERYNNEIITCDICGAKMVRKTGTQLEVITDELRYGCPVSPEVLNYICKKVMKDNKSEQLACPKCKSEIKNKIQEFIEKALNYENVEAYPITYEGQIDYNPQITQEICTDWHRDRIRARIVLRQLAAVDGFDVIYDCDEEWTEKYEGNYIKNLCKYKGIASHKI